MIEMRFGKTHREQFLAKQRTLWRRAVEGARRFAWLPVTMHDGRKLWLGDLDVED